MDFLTPTLPYIKFLQQFHFLLRPMQLFSLLGTEYCYLALLPVIYWAVSRSIGARLGALLLFSSIVNEIVKVGFALPRPYWIEPGLQLGHEASFGFPSGHAQNAWLVWPFLALYSKNRRLWVPLSIVLAICITVSRNYLGVHFPADSLGGTFIGLSILGLARAGGPAWMRFWRQLAAWQKILFSLFATLFLGGIYAMAMYHGTSPYITGYDDSLGPQFQTALQNAIAGGQIATRLGAFCGLLVGVSLLAHLSAFKPKVPLKVMAPRLMLGFLGLAVFYGGLKFIGAKTGLSGSVGWSFVNYFATTFWVAFAAPYVFDRFLGQQKRRVV